MRGVFYILLKNGYSFDDESDYFVRCTVLIIYKKINPIFIRILIQCFVGSFTVSV